MMTQREAVEKDTKDLDLRLRWQKMEMNGEEE